MRNMELKPALDGVVRWMDEKGPGGRSFRESLEAGGVIADDLVVVSGAITGLLNSGLTREAFIVLLQAKIGNQRNGRPMPAATITDVLDALENLHTFLVNHSGAPVPERVELAKRQAKGKKQRSAHHYEGDAREDP